MLRRFLLAPHSLTKDSAQCMVYLAQVSYINDCYSISAASALSGLVMCRSVFGAVFPLFANKVGLRGKMLIH